MTRERRIDVGRQATDETVDRGSRVEGTLVVVEKSGHAVSFHDVAGGTLLERIELGEYPHEMVVDGARRLAYIGHYGVRMSGDVGTGGSSVFVVDLAARRLVRTIDLSPFNRLHGIAIDDQDRLYVLSEEKAVLLRVDDPAHAEAPSAAVPTGGIKTHMVVTNHDGSLAYVTGLLSHTVSRVDPHDAAQPPVIASPGRLPESCALSRDEQWLYVGARRDKQLVTLDARTLKEHQRQDVPGDPLRVYVVPGQDRLLTTDIENRTVTRYDAELREERSVTFDGTPAGISFHPTEPTAFVTLLDIDTVAILDLETFETTGTISTGSEPDVTALI
ncbi:YncE family protein [Prauserella isguenensis]|uniref:YncE family protein n=1 Tax=Prauserella isguenensis TaxID=1470180 RepID=UPI00161F4780|nr:YncE family protein [Prauserella isguenensis]